MCSIPRGKTPASHTTQEWMRRLYIRRCCQFHIHLGGTSSTFCTVSTSTLPAPVPIPLCSHQHSFEKLAANLVQLIFMGTSCCLTRRSWQGRVPAWIVMVNWSCIYCKWGQISDARHHCWYTQWGYWFLFLFLNWEYWATMFMATRWTASTLRSVQSSTSVAVAMASTNRQCHLEYISNVRMCCSDVVRRSDWFIADVLSVSVFKRPSQPLETITWHRGTIAGGVKHDRRIIHEPLRYPACIVWNTFGCCLGPLTGCFQLAECSLFNCLLKQRVDMHLLYSTSVERETVAL